ncbi:hypothetical protein AcetOrient_orf02461 [Acetobacter orientalis]|uniref:Uncharacterized protein n=1 Tax=Acetobacter orientalis TaxID=146474 RepID=A0A2Z5ZHG9_9PROT|nr:hypothetical protein AcetOrient_orf02461 [Acetobacter orientalis]
MQNTSGAVLGVVGKRFTNRTNNKTLIKSWSVLCNKLYLRAFLEIHG